MISGVGASALAEGKRGAFYNTLEEFHKHWDHIDIICPKIRNESSGQWPSFRPQRQPLGNLEFFNNVKIHPSPWPKILQPFWILKKGLEVYRQDKFDIVTVHEYPPFYNGLGARMLWNKIKIPYVVEIMHMPGYPRVSDLKEFFYKFLTRVFISIDSSKAKAIRVINKNEVPGFLKKAGVLENRIEYIPAFYIDLDIFRPMNLEKKYDLIFVGRLEKNKGINLLLEIAKKSSLKILIVGDGSMKEDINKWIQDYNGGLLGFKDRHCNLIYYGWAKDSAEVAKLINESRALIMLSYNEGGPRVILEALACGVPVIATPVGIVPDVLSFNNGRIVEWSSNQAIKAFEEVKNIKVETDLSRFDKAAAIKNYADNIKSLI